MEKEILDSSLLAGIEADAVNIAQTAGQILLKHFRKPTDIQFKDKDKCDPVTTVDHLCEEYTKNAIKEKYPSHNILSEEAGSLSEVDSPFLWVVDPLDGTINYINGLPVFAVSIGVLWQQTPVVGCIFSDFSHSGTHGVYHARLGNGTFFNGQKIGLATGEKSCPIFEVPGQSRDLARYLHYNRRKPYEIRNFGSIAVEMAMTANGIFQFALFNQPKIWDVAAGVVLVKEAGGAVLTRTQGKNSWLSLDKFQTKKGGQVANLKDWSFPVIAGDANTVQQVARDIKVHRSLLPRLRFKGKTGTEK